MKVIRYTWRQLERLAQDRGSWIGTIDGIHYMYVTRSELSKLSQSACDIPREKLGKKWIHSRL